jgi:hypothetical protein
MIFSIITTESVTFVLLFQTTIPGIGHGGLNAYDGPQLQ